MINELLNETEAATLLRVKPVTLRAWRTRKCGPAFVKVGRLIRYEREQISRYLSERSHSF